MDIKLYAVILAFILIIYLFFRRKKSLEFRSRIHKNRGVHLSHDEYIKSVVAEGNRKEEEGRIRAEERERIRKGSYRL